MKINLISENFSDVVSDLEVIFVLNKNLEQKNIKDKQLLEALNFKANDEEVLLLPELQRVYVGCEEISYDGIAVAISSVVKKIQTTNFITAKLELFNEERSTLKALVEGIIMGAYRFTKYKSEEKADLKQEITIVC